MNRILISSKKILFNDNNELVASQLQLIDSYENHNIKLSILTRQQNIAKLQSQLPEKYKNKVVFLNRSSSNYSAHAQHIQKSMSEGDIYSMLGFNNNDAIFAFQMKIPLFNLIPYTVGEKVKKYGLPIIEYADIVNCYNSYEITNEVYYHQFTRTNDYHVMSLNNANTFYRPDNEQRIKKLFQENLKNDENNRDRKVLLVIYFHLIREILTNDLFKDVKYWGNFPSSKADNINTSVYWLKECIRCCVGGLPQNASPILIREHTRLEKKKSHNKGVDKCNIDFSSIYLNPKLRYKLEGQVVCIIDDYMTTGYSAEATKHLLRKAGVKKIIFITMGKFGKTYMNTNYKIEGDVYSSNYSATFITEVERLCDYNLTRDQTILKFGPLLF